jgi:hypothetical protein
MPCVLTILVVDDWKGWKNNDGPNEQLTWLTIVKKNSGERITSVTYGGRKIVGYFVDHSALQDGKELVITTK